MNIQEMNAHGCDYMNTEVLVTMYAVHGSDFQMQVLLFNCDGVACITMHY